MVRLSTREMLGRRHVRGKSAGAGAAGGRYVWRMKLFRCALVALMLIGTAGRTDAQEREPDLVPDGARDRVALVLGGGGARGLAHVGVLRALHEARIPVDVVIGTSMGAIVGGLYASGLPVAEIERLFESRDWPELFDDDPPRQQIRLRRKREERELLIGFELGVGPGGIRIPPGLIGGDKLLTLLQVHTLHTLDVHSFDDFGLPFRAVATDAQTGERVVLDRGSLARAVRASASVPGAFSPVLDEDRELVDGGLVDNLPIELARELGVDIVIAVDVGSTLDEEVTSALGIAERALTIMIRAASTDQVSSLTASDWLIEPDLAGISASSFSTPSYERAVAAGLQAARSDERPAGLTVDDAAFRRWNDRRTSGWDADAAIRVTRVDAKADRTRLSPEVVTGVFPFRAGDVVGREQLAAGVSQVLGYGGFASAGLTLERTDEGTALELEPVDKPWGPGVVRTGILLEDRQRGSATWVLRALLTHARLNRWGGILRAEIQVGTRQRARLEWYQPLTVSERFFTILRGEVARNDELIPRAGGTEIVDVGEAGVELGSGVRIGTWGEAAVGLRLSRVDVDRSRGNDGAVQEAKGLTNGFVTFEADALDRAAFPSRGVLTRWGLASYGTFLGGSERFDRLAVDALVPVSFGSHTIILSAELGTAFGDSLALGSDFTLGGLFRLSAAERGTIRGSYSGLGRVIYYLRPGSPAARREGSPIRLGLSFEAGQAWEPDDDIRARDFLFGGTVFGAVDTPLGPVHGGWAWLRERSPTWFFRMGPVF